MALMVNQLTHASVLKNVMIRACNFLGVHILCA